MKTWFHGNYFTVRFDSFLQYDLMMRFADRYFAYELRRWNREKKAYEYVMYRRYWFNPEKQEFTTYRGLAVRVKKILETTKTGKINMKYVEAEPDFSKVVFLRKYQLEALKSILSQIEFQGSATLQACTGSGKTEVAVALHKVIEPEKTFFLSLNTDLLIQARNRFRKYNVEAGLVNKDHFEIDRQVVCCTVQTLYRAIKTYETHSYEEEKVNEEIKHLLEETEVEDKKKLYETYKEAELVIMDECQHVPSRTVWYSSMANEYALRFAMSATPWRDDGRDLDIYACYGDRVSRVILSSELISLGYLVPVRIYFAHYFPSYSGRFKHVRGGPWVYNAVKKMVYMDSLRNRKIAELAYKSPKPFMILVREIKHGEAVAEECRRLGLRTAFLYGEVNPDLRSQVFNMVRNREIDGLVCTTLADEGLDLPPLRTLILAGGGKSSTRALQRVGRITRPFKGKKEGIVIDIYDHVRYFEEHAEKRRKIYLTEPGWKMKDIVI